MLLFNLSCVCEPEDKLILSKGLETVAVTMMQKSSFFVSISVGGGTAGCVLANRLTADPKIKVALIEAGDEETVYHMSDIPLMSSELHKTPMDWQDQTASQTGACGSMVDQVSCSLKR